MSPKVTNRKVLVSWAPCWLAVGTAPLNFNAFNVCSYCTRGKRAKGGAAMSSCVE